VEDSIYIAPEAQGKGIGTMLLQALIDASTAKGFRQMIAVIGDSAQAASIALHAAAGFRMVGTFEAVGFKFDRWLDSVLMQLPLGMGATTAPISESCVPVRSAARRRRLGVMRGTSCCPGGRLGRDARDRQRVRSLTTRTELGAIPDQQRTTERDAPRTKLPTFPALRAALHPGYTSGQPVTTLNDRSIARSTGSRSWPRRTIKPVAEMTL
jgi:hypothetical protein